MTETAAPEKKPYQRHFPDIIDAYLKYTSGHEATKRCHLWSLIPVIAACLERKVWLDRGFYILYPNLYVFIVGKSGLVKKSTTTSIAVNLAREIKTLRLMSERVTAASLIKQLHSAGKEFEFRGKKFKQSPVFVYASELSVFLNEVFGSTHELLTTFYDCVPHDSSKPWIYETRHAEALKIFGPCLNILGASTKTWLRKAIPGTEMEAGFSSRIIFVVENHGPDKLVAWPEVDTSLGCIQDQLAEDLKHISTLVGKFEVTDRAKELFRQWYEFHMKNIVPMNMDPKFSGYMGRKGDLMLKLAMVRSASMRDTLVMEDTDLLWAGEQLEALEPEMRAAFEGVGSSPVGEITFDIRNYIRSRGKVEKAEIRRAFAQDLPGYELEKCINDLIEMREIKIVEEHVEGVKVAYFVSAGHGLFETSL